MSETKPDHASTDDPSLSHASAEHASNAMESAGSLDMRVIQDLRELGGEDDPGLILELIGIFLEDAPQRMDEISRGLATGDLKLLERAAHTLKSSSANIGALGLSKICKQIEEIARTQNLAGVKPLIDASTRTLTDVERALRAIQS